MKEFLTMLGSIIAAVSFLPYLKDTIQKKVKPRIASWATWSLITAISTAAAIVAHAYTSAALTGVATLVEVSVLVFALRNGETEYIWIDGISQTLSLLGIIFWLTTKNPLLAILFNILADLIASIPTYYHAFIDPHEESSLSFVIFGFGSLVTIFGVI